MHTSQIKPFVLSLSKHEWLDLTVKPISGRSAYTERVLQNLLRRIKLIAHISGHLGMRDFT